MWLYNYYNDNIKNDCTLRFHVMKFQLLEEIRIDVQSKVYNWLKKALIT